MCFFLNKNTQQATPPDKIKRMKINKTIRQEDIYLIILFICFQCRLTYKQAHLLFLINKCFLSFPAFLAQILSRDFDDTWVKFTVSIEVTYRKGAPERSARKAEALLWLPKADLACKCPKVRVGRKYLFVGKSRPEDKIRPGYVVDRSTTVLRSRDKWQRRLRQFVEREMNGEC